MELKDKLLSSFMAFEEKIDFHQELHDMRSQAIKNFESKGFPTKKEESCPSRIISPSVTV